MADEQPNFHPSQKDEEDLSWKKLEVKIMPVIAPCKAEKF